MTDQPPTPLEKNVERLLKAAKTTPKAGFEDRMVGIALEQVRRESPAKSRPLQGSWILRQWRIGRFAMAASVVVVLVFGGVLAVEYWTPQRTNVGKARAVYGLVGLRNGGAYPLAGWQDLDPKEWILTQWGSRAEVELADRSRLITQPQSELQLKNGRKGQSIFLKEGMISIEAAKQTGGRVLRIQTPGARVSVLGTKLDVHVVQKSDGHKQTRVSVASGQVALESGGKKILLPANTEGIADEGSAPQRRCLTPEINEMARLRKLNEQLATQKGVKTGNPAMVEFECDASAVVWVVARLDGDSRTTRTLKLSRDVARIEAFTEEGSPLGVILSGRTIAVPPMMGESVESVKNPGKRIIVKLVGVQGLFARQDKGVVACDLAGDGSKSLSLLQLRLPEQARIETIQPEPVETRKSLSRQLITLPMSSPALESAVFTD